MSWPVAKDNQDYEGGGRGGATTDVPRNETLRNDLIEVDYGQGSQKLYNWQNILLSPTHHRNGVHHPVEIISLPS